MREHCQWGHRKIDTINHGNKYQLRFYTPLSLVNISESVHNDLFKRQGNTFSNNGNHSKHVYEFSKQKDNPFLRKMSDIIIKT